MLDKSYVCIAKILFFNYSHLYEITELFSIQKFLNYFILKLNIFQVLFL